jgi:hypothetical protein
VAFLIIVSADYSMDRPVLLGNSDLNLETPNDVEHCNACESLFQCYHPDNHLHSYLHLVCYDRCALAKSGV